MRTSLVSMMYYNISQSSTCKNRDCPYFEKETGKSVIKYGRTKRGFQKYLCQYCNKTFIETQGSHLYNKRLSNDDIIKIYRLLINKNSICSIEKKTNHHKHTISNLLHALLADPKGAENIIFHSIKVKKSDIDNMWDTIHKNIKKGDFRER
jgi:transposase-like protein